MIRQLKIHVCVRLMALILSSGVHLTNEKRLPVLVCQMYGKIPVVSKCVSLDYTAVAGSGMIGPVNR